MAGFYTVYHGEGGIKSIARKIHATTVSLDKACRLWATTSSTRLILIRCA
jgi:glycine cleavage system pyridoxal-binding protein P